MLKYCFVLFSILSFSPILHAQTTGKKLPIVIDADTANEVDDLYALVRAILEPSFDLRGITSAQFHISTRASDSTVRERQTLNEDIVRLMGKEDIPLPIGANMPITSSTKPSISPASNFIIEQAKKQSPENPLHVVILGSCTNVASAILQDPSIIPLIKVHYLGIWHTASTNYYNKKEFNSMNDMLALNVIFNTPDLDLTIMSATASQALVFDRNIVNTHLKGNSEIGDYLVNRWEDFDQYLTSSDIEKGSWIMWDVAMIESLVDPSFGTKSGFMTPPENSQRMINIYTKVNAPAMEADYWKVLDESLPKK